MKIKIYLFSVCFLTIAYNYCQELNDEIQKLKIYDLEAISNFDNSKLSILEKEYLEWQKQLIRDGYTDSIYIDNLKHKQSKSAKDSTLKSIMLGDYYLFKKIPKESVAYEYYIKSINIALKTNDSVLITESCKKIFKQLFKSKLSLNSYPTYLNIYQNYLYDNNEKANYFFHLFNYEGSKKNRIERIDGFKDALKLIDKSDNSFLKAKINQMIGVQYDYFRKNSDSSLFYYLKAKSLMQEKPYQFYYNELFGINANIALIYSRKKDFKNAIKYFQYSDSINLPKYRFEEKVKINQLLADIEIQNNNWEGAYYYLEKSNIYSDTLNEYKTAAEVFDVMTKYDTKEKENKILKLSNENLLIEAKRKRNQNFLIAALSLLFFVGITSLLIQKNTKRKQKLAEQEKALETQKLTTVLKEQELNAIDAMIEGQEKERQRIANDLHDDLGGLMATVKLHFNALKDKNTPELYEKTNNLIDEAYQKVRTVAHAKNSGVIAKQGLLKAVNQMADKISAANNINIEVIDHGLENRLENSLELTIFRIIQELITNVIKHAKASEVTIHFTNHEESLNIMVEDNGVGFNPSQITKTNKGMGISSIDKRVEHLDGSMTIESEKSKGTTIIIDIPL